MAISADIKISPENLLPWSNMEDWDNGVSSAPTEHTLSGAGASVARESTTIKIGTYSAAVTRAGADTALYYNLPSYADYLGRKMTFGAWVYATVASRARLSISDGVGSTNSSYHTGGSSWEYLTVTRNIDPSATRIRSEMQVNTGNTTAYFDGGILCEGDTTLVILTDYADIGQWTESNRYVSQEFKVARRVGIKMPLTQIESKSINVECMVTGSTVQATRDNFDTLQEIINSFRTKANSDVELRDLYIYNDRLIKCHLKGTDPSNLAALRIKRMTLNFVAPEPFYQFVNKSRKKQTISGTPTTFTVSVLGNAFSRPFFTITNSSSNITSLTIENLTSGQTFSFSGTIVTNQNLEVDCDLFVVENNDVDAVSSFTGDLDTILLPGDNEIKVTGLVSGTVKVDWFDRYL